ncbi:RluA family pseudouridine synthase [bacterium]|jgi:23S rRNA pseudouridine1911/1915/1917 synthase|nr:RluA family pseudouridine synthase [bacterium]
MSNVRQDLSENTYLVTYDVGPNQTGMRLDAFLKDHYRKRSREALKRAIDSGSILVQRNQGPHVTVGKLKPSLQLLAGDEVMVVSEKKPEPAVCFDYKILFEDDHLYVIEKPANLPVHPAGRYFFNTLLIHLRTEGHRNPLRANQEYYLVHRIDKETSGILVLAKTKEACTDITRQFAERQTEKTYLAITHGVTPEEFTVDLAMRRSTTSIIGLKMTTAPESEGGQSASTGFKRLEVAGDFSLVECYPKTGRQHQIRVHLDAKGHPIVGDKLYGRPEGEAVNFYDRVHLTPEAEAKLLLPRHALHAHKIRFTHPITRKLQEFVSPLPQDLRDFLSAQTQGPRHLPIFGRMPAEVPGPSPLQT